MELKDFENKINDITDKFMSLLETDDVIDYANNNKANHIVDFANNGKPNYIEDYLNNSKPNYAEDYANNNKPNYIEDYLNNGKPNNVIDFASINKPNNIIDDDNIIDFSKIINNESPTEEFSPFKLSTNDISIGGIRYDNNAKDGVGGNIIRFDTVEQIELNNKLEDLYQKKNSLYTKNMSIGFADTNYDDEINNNFNIKKENNENLYTKDKIINKEGNDMANYGGIKNGDNELFSFATIPAEKALVEKRSFADTLFMDIPWDTKIDIWGSFKQFCRAQVKITF